MTVCVCVSWHIRGEALSRAMDGQNYQTAISTRLKWITGLFEWFLLALKTPSHRLMGQIHLHSHKQYISQCGDLKEYDSLSSRASRCVSPFLCSCPRHQRDHTDQCSLFFSFEGASAFPEAPHLTTTITTPSPSLMKASTYLPIHFHLFPGTPSPSCHHGLVYEPLLSKDRLIEDLAQLRPAWFPFAICFLIRHFISFLTACLPAAKLSPKPLSLSYVFLCVCMCVCLGLTSMVALRYKTQPHFTNQIQNQRDTCTTEYLMSTVFQILHHILAVDDHFIGPTALLPHMAKAIYYTAVSETFWSKT